MNEKKNDEASRLINLAIKDYDLFLTEINTYSPEKKNRGINLVKKCFKIY